LREQLHRPAQFDEPAAHLLDRVANANGTSLAVLTAPTLDQGLSFVGGFVGPSDPRIARVRITLGNAVLGAFDNNAGTDVVVTDESFSAISASVKTARHPAIAGAIGSFIVSHHAVRR